MAISEQVAARAIELFAGTEFQASVLSGILLAAVGVGLRIIRGRPRIVWANNHQFAFYLPPPPGSPAEALGLPVTTRTIHVSNQGAAPAKSVEVQFTGRPGHFQIWPPLEREDVVLDDGHFIIKVPLVAPREGFVIEILQTNQNMPNVVRVRSEAGVAKEISVTPTPIMSPQRVVALLTLITLGAWTAVRWIITFVIAAVS